MQEDSSNLKENTTISQQSAHRSQTQQIRIVLTVMIMSSMLAHVVDVKGTFLHGEFEDGGIMHMKVLQDFEKHFPEGSVLLLKKHLYGLNQAVKAFWRQLLHAASAMGLKRSISDPYLMSWIDDNAIVGQESDTVDLWMSTWDAQLKSWRQDESSFGRKC